MAVPPSVAARKDSCRDRLFLALKPEADEAMSIWRRAGSLGERWDRAQRINAGCLHLSLVSLGDHAGLPPLLVNRACSIASGIEARLPGIEFDRLSRFGGDAIVLRSRGPLNAVQTLRRVLLQAMSVMPVVRLANSRHCEPHMTVFYAKTAPFDEEFGPVIWRPRQLQLIHSVVGQGLHRTIASWPLTGGPAIDLPVRTPCDLFNPR